MAADPGREPEGGALVTTVLSRTGPAPARRAFKPATTPVCGTVRARVEITTDKGVHSDFGIVFLDPDPHVARAAVRLVKSDGEMYDVALGADGVVRCDCGDGVFHPERPGGCKHIVALRTLVHHFGGVAALATAPTVGGFPPPGASPPPSLKS